MTPEAERLKTELSRLGPEDRAELAEFLLGSLDEEPDVAPRDAWDAELARRVEEIQSGAVQGIPVEDVFARLRRTHERPNRTYHAIASATTNAPSAGLPSEVSKKGASRFGAGL